MSEGAGGVDVPKALFYLSLDISVHTVYTVYTQYERGRQIATTHR